MVSCNGSPKEVKDFSSESSVETSIEASAVTELDSSSAAEVRDETSSIDNSIADVVTDVDSSLCAADPSTTSVETSSVTEPGKETTITEVVVKETTTTTDSTIFMDAAGQLVEQPVEVIVTKPMETSTIVEDIIITDTNENCIGLDSYSYQLLAEIVEHEAGADYIGIYEKAHVAAATMNRVYDSRFPNTVYENLIDQSQFPGFYIGTCYPSQESYNAVDYYLTHSGEFDGSNSWWGDGFMNHFYYQ